MRGHLHVPFSWDSQPGWIPVPAGLCALPSLPCPSRVRALGEAAEPGLEELARSPAGWFCSQACQESNNPLFTLSLPAALANPAPGHPKKRCDPVTGTPRAGLARPHRALLSFEPSAPKSLLTQAHLHPQLLHLPLFHTSLLLPWGSFGASSRPSRSHAELRGRAVLQRPKTNQPQTIPWPAPALLFILQLRGDRRESRRESSSASQGPPARLG